MKNRFPLFLKLLLAPLLVTGILIQLQFTGQNDPNEHFKLFVKTGLVRVSDRISELNKVAADYKAGTATLQELQEQLAKTRLAYKEIESITTFYFPEHEKYYINGAPLEHADPYPIGEEYEGKSYYGISAAEYVNALPLDLMEAGHYLDGTVHIIAPVGLQRLDELVFADEAPESKEAIIALCKDLQVKFFSLQNELLRRKYFHEFEVIDLSRMEIIRVLTKGITGFDTPGSLNGVQEAAASLSGLEKLLEPLIASGSPQLRETVNTLFAGAVMYVQKHPDFEEFDRLVFIKEYLNPIYTNLLYLKKELGLKSSAEKFGNTPSWNANSTQIFSEDFLNPYFYSILKAKDDSPQLRALGKKLFFDTRLSKGNNLSCASCHLPEKAYSDGERTSLAGVPGQRVLRNSPSLINAVFSDRYFYDLRAFDLEDQAAHVVENHMEFNTSFQEITAMLQNTGEYKKEFLEVFGKEEMTRYDFSKALASFVLSLRSFDSEFDRYMRGEIKTIDKKVKKGFNLFMGKANCGTCHYAPTFSGLVPPLYNENESEVLGVLSAPEGYKADLDEGRFANGVTNEKLRIHKYSFKTVTLRNAALTAPYFHNGAYNTLDEVLEFYNSGGGAGRGLEYEVPNQTLSPDPLNLSKSELSALKAFIESLTSLPGN